MSRSFKKVSIVKDHNKGSKQISKQIVRAAEKRGLINYLDEDLDIPNEKSLYCSYNVCDYKWFTKDTKYCRK